MQCHKDHKMPFLMSGCKVADGYGVMLVIKLKYGLIKQNSNITFHCMGKNVRYRILKFHFKHIFNVIFFGILEDDMHSMCHVSIKKL